MKQEEGGETGLSKEEVVRDEGLVDDWNYAIETDWECGVGRVIEWMVLISGYLCD